MTQSKRAALYLRVSTDNQTVDNQRLALEQVAAHRGWHIVETYTDHGISGAKSRDKRPAFNAMCNDATQGKLDVVMAWSVDRLGRSLQDLVVFLNELRDLKVDLFLHKQGMDTTTASGRMLFQMCGVFAEFEREMIRDRINAGLARARKNGVKLGRRPIDSATEKRIERELAKGLGITKIAKQLGVGGGTVHRIRQRMNGSHISMREAAS
jgi:DNA invertase Pin-like site-specific DNA recombinase